jgi:CD109 antigen
VAFFSQVNITTNTEETQPGTDVELIVEAKPNSYVGILGVDQSVLLLKSGNDITKVILYFSILLHCIVQ